MWSRGCWEGCEGFQFLVLFFGVGLGFRWKLIFFLWLYGDRWRTGCFACCWCPCCSLSAWSCQRYQGMETTALNLTPSSSLIPCLSLFPSTITNEPWCWAVPLHPPCISRPNPQYGQRQFSRDHQPSAPPPPGSPCRREFSCCPGSCARTRRQLL